MLQSGHRQMLRKYRVGVAQQLITLQNRQSQLRFRQVVRTKKATAPADGSLVGGGGSRHDAGRIELDFDLKPIYFEGAGLHLLQRFVVLSGQFPLIHLSGHEQLYLFLQVIHNELF